MRKLFPMLLFTLLLALLMAVPALAADFTYDDFSATLTVPDSYTMVTTSNLADHEDLLAKQGLTVEAAQADGSYALHLKYIDRDSEFDEKGAYKVKGNLLTLTPMDGQPEYYKVEENQVRKLDADKQPVTGALAENYVLKKTE